MNAPAQLSGLPPRASQSLLLGWMLPVGIGLLIACALIADELLLRGLSLRWAAPYMRDLAPPIVMLLLAGLLVAAIVTVIFISRWFPPRDYALITLLFIPTQLVGFSLANIEPLKICLLITTGIWLIQTFSKDGTVRLYRPFLMIWLIILIFSSLSIMNGQVTSFVSQYTIVAKFLMFFMVANVLRTEDQLVFTVRLLVWLGIISAVAAILQEGLFYYFKIPLSLDDNSTKYWFKETPLGWMIRATGFHPTSQNLSHYLLMAMCMLMLGPFTNKLRFWGSLLMTGGIFFTFTGNGLVALAFVLFLMPIVHRPRFTLHYLCTVLCIALVLYQTGVLEIVYEKYLLPLSGKSAEDRVELLQTGLEVLGRHPWIGMGLNNFGRISPQPVHNAYMQLVTEIGLVPGALLLLIMLLIFVRLLVGLGNTPEGPVRQCGKGIFLAFTGLIFHFMFEPFINSLVSWSIIGLAEATALILTIPRLRDRALSITGPRPRDASHASVTSTLHDPAPA